jgi:predicted site-specific integrase-resolvase
MVYNQSNSAASQDEKFLSENEILKRVPVCRKTWFNWIKAGKIPVVKISRRKLYHWGNVQAALLRMERNGRIEQ